MRVMAQDRGETPRTGPPGEPDPVAESDADVIRRAFEIWNEVGPEALVDRFYAEDAVYREMPGSPDAGVYRGRAAVLRRLQSLVEFIGHVEVHLDDLIDAGDGRYVAIASMAGESAEDEPPYTQSFGVVHRVRRGLVTEADYYLDPAEALKAAGLPER
jgi:ketosteroid isomerase-like protein